jgi:hypothetical protein
MKKPKPRSKPRKKATTKTNKTPKRKLPVPQLGMSVDQFCAAFNIGRDLFYELLAQGRAPETILLSKRRRIISVEAAQRWAKAREAETRKAAA